MYCTERVLPIYSQAVQEARIMRGEWAVLQEVNDPSMVHEVPTILRKSLRIKIGLIHLLPI